MQAINYYEAALKSENQQFLRSDLAELYLKLRQFDRAERTLTAGLSHGDGRLMCEEGMERGGEEGGRKERRKRGRGGEGGESVTVLLKSPLQETAAGLIWPYCNRMLCSTVLLIE